MLYFFLLFLLLNATVEIRTQDSDDSGSGEGDSTTAGSTTDVTTNATKIVTTKAPITTPSTTVTTTTLKPCTKICENGGKCLFVDTIDFKEYCKCTNGYTSEDCSLQVKKAVTMAFTFTEEFSEELNNPESEKYKDMEANVLKMATASFAATMGGEFSVVINNFYAGSIKANISVLMADENAAVPKPAALMASIAAACEPDCGNLDKDADKLEIKPITNLCLISPCPQYFDTCDSNDTTPFYCTCQDGFERGEGNTCTESCTTATRCSEKQTCEVEINDIVRCIDPTTAGPKTTQSSPKVCSFLQSGPDCKELSTTVIIILVLVILFAVLGLITLIVGIILICKKNKISNFEEK